MLPRSIAIVAVQVCLAILPVLAGSTNALTIALDFVDSSPFASNSTARATIEKAASDISAAITQSLSPINQPVVQGQYEWQRSNTSSGQTLTLTYGWNYFYKFADQGDVNVPAELLPANTIKLFVRGQAFSDNTLGEGGSAGSNLEQGVGLASSSSVSQSLLQTQFTNLTNQVTSLVNSELQRNGGPVIATRSGTSSFDFGNGLAISAPYSISYGPAYGTLALDTSWGGQSFDQYWHINHATPVAGGKNDLYSVALHEMLHAIGYGSSETWEDLANGTTWTGAQASAEHGTGLNLVSNNHVANGIMSQRITDGAMQEAAMDPNLTIGTRKYLTTLDLAFLRDLGYSTILPDFGLAGDFNGDGMVDLGDYSLWRDNLGASTEAAINNNGNGGGVTSADYLLWKNNLGMTSASLIASFDSGVVPEPSSGWLAIAAVAATGTLCARVRNSRR